jgi:hypothetical protein
MTRFASQLSVQTDSSHSYCLLAVSGVLDSSTYLELRNAIIKAAIDQPSGVLIDVTALRVPAPSAWAVFTSARWHVSIWPDVPISLVCAHERGRDEITRNGVARYVPVYPSEQTALANLLDHRQSFKRRVVAELPAVPASLRTARRLATEVLLEWSLPELVAVATVIVNVFLENVLEHTESAPVLRLESNGTLVTIAVADGSSVLPARHEDAFTSKERVSGLAIVAAVCRAWGNTPTPSGKTVWAVIGPENRL